jgi:hypothetical protein
LSAPRAVKQRGKPGYENPVGLFWARTGSLPGAPASGGSVIDRGERRSPPLDHEGPGGVVDPGLRTFYM